MLLPSHGGRPQGRARAYGVCAASFKMRARMAAVCDTPQASTTGLNRNGPVVDRLSRVGSTGKMRAKRCTIGRPRYASRTLSKPAVLAVFTNFLSKQASHARCLKPPNSAIRPGGAPLWPPFDRRERATDSRSAGCVGAYRPRKPRVRMGVGILASQGWSGGQ
jgi:hypothetical protein